MPLYDFLCPKCGKTAELMVDADVKRAACESCFYPLAERQLSAPAVFNLKGDGFYKPRK